MGIPRPLFGYFVLVDGELYEHELSGIDICPMFDTRDAAEEFIQGDMAYIDGEKTVVNTSARECR